MAAYTTPLGDDQTWTDDLEIIAANNVHIAHNKSQKYQDH